MYLAAMRIRHKRDLELTYYARIAYHADANGWENFTARMMGGIDPDGDDWQREAEELFRATDGKGSEMGGKK